MQPEEATGTRSGELNLTHGSEPLPDHLVLIDFQADEREQVRRQLAGTLQAVVCQRMVATVVLIKALGGGWLGLPAQPGTKSNPGLPGSTSNAANQPAIAKMSSK